MTPMTKELVRAENYFSRIEGFVMIPNSVWDDPPYATLPTESKVLYGKLLGLLRLSAADTTGCWQHGGRPFVSLSRENAGTLLHCRRDKAARLFLQLVRCGLLEEVPNPSPGKAKRYYLNLPRPKEPNEL